MKNYQSNPCTPQIIWTGNVEQWEKFTDWKASSDSKKIKQKDLMTVYEAFLQDDADLWWEAKERFWNLEKKQNWPLVPCPTNQKSSFKQLFLQNKKKYGKCQETKAWLVTLVDTHKARNN